MSKLTLLKLLSTFCLALVLVAGTAILAHASSFAQTAAEGQTIFQQKCMACHTIGKGKLVGPDLQGVTSLRPADWLARWIKEPDKMLAEKDATALQLLQEFNNVRMPNLKLTDAQVAAVLAYLENPDQAGQGPAATVALPTNGDPARGKALFSGGTLLANGGPNCIACHSAAGVSQFGGGTLGPDLTHVFQRLGGPGLASALATIPFPTMTGVFVNRPLTAAEQADLYAFLEQADQSPQVASAAPVIWYWGIGIAGALLLFILLAFFWPRQRQSLSDRLRNSA